MIYLFLGQDSLAKDIQLSRLRQESIAKETEQFNLDVLYARELSLKDLQEKLSRLPVNNRYRLVAVKNAQELKEESREFILKYCQSPYKQIILILDIDGQAKTDGFIKGLSKYARVCRFKETKRLDAFSLSRQIQLGRPDYALRVLNQILKEGDRPERILGGLRYFYERGVASPLQVKKGLKSLVNCDIEIKTGRLKPAFALEKLVIYLCGLSKPFC